jgi:hypothetical protein
VFAGNLIDDDHAPDRFPLAYRPVTARQRRPGVGLAPVGGRTRGGAQTPCFESGYTLGQLGELAAVSGEPPHYSELVDDSAASAAEAELGEAERGGGS